MVYSGLELQIACTIGVMIVGAIYTIATKMHCLRLKVYTHQSIIRLVLKLQ